jgi:hypothetical protein|tara:strand:+ start:590 stop:991 length:402 start_codon:yes stop_codon:yes gene_type:complete
LQEYKNLSFEDNHKIIKDAHGEYWWHSRKDTKFTKHCIKAFTDYKKALSNIKFWLPIYKKLATNPLECLDKMIKQLILEDEINSIASNKDYSLTKKLSKIVAINSSIAPKDLALLLDVTRMTISRQLKLFKAI